MIQTEKNVLNHLIRMTKKVQWSYELYKKKEIQTITQKGPLEKLRHLKRQMVHINHKQINTTL